MNKLKNSEILSFAEDSGCQKIKAFGCYPADIIAYRFEFANLEKFAFLIENHVKEQCLKICEEQVK